MGRLVKEGGKFRQRFAFAFAPIQTVSFVHRTVRAGERGMIERDFKQTGGKRKEIIGRIEWFAPLRFRRAIGRCASPPRLLADRGDEVVVREGQSTAITDQIAGADIAMNKALGVQCCERLTYLGAPTNEKTFDRLVSTFFGGEGQNTGEPV